MYASWVNACEVYDLTLRSATGDNRKVLAGKALEIIKSLPLEMVPAGEAECVAAGRLKARFSVSLADSFAAGLAEMYGASLATADPEFKTLEKAGILKVFWLPEKNRGQRSQARSQSHEEKHK